jgi:hypothetical protein
MSLRRWLHATCVVLVGCNALTGVSELGVAGDFAPGDAPPPSSTEAGGDGRLPRADAADPRDGNARDTTAAADATDDTVTVKDSATDVVGGGPPPGARRAFVTSATSPPNFGGIAGADDFCAMRASAASLGGTWVAWLSSGKAGGTHALNRVTSAGPWYLLSGAMVAADKASLASGTLAHAIDRDELNRPASGTVWTGTGPAGRYMHNACGAWANLNGQQGRFGSIAATDASWTSAGNGPCNGSRAVYCFEL